MSNNILNLLNKIYQAKVLCAGDIMLDRYIYTKASRLSPEAPVPIVLVKNQKYLPGGVGNVVNNLITLKASVKLVTLAGDDNNFKVLEDMMSAFKGLEQSIICEKNRPTTIKSRLLAGIQQLVRFDEEITTDIEPTTEKILFQNFENFIKTANSAIISDYGKGLINNSTSPKLIDIALRNKKPVIVDPKGRDYAKYSQAFLVTPNLNELMEASNLHLDENDEDAIAEAGRQLINQYQFQNLLITRSDKGMMLLKAPGSKDKPILLPSKAIDVFDVSGAGDTVVALIGACLALNAPLEEAAALATLAAGVVVGKVGTATASAEEIKAMINF